jgi:protein O-GlcNAcase/histone acetyltransferase
MNDIICGVIEGFYGPPWTWEQRQTLVEWMSAGKLNTYLYAPKDDLKHRIGWRTLYTSAEAQLLADLIARCRENEITFVYAIAPGLDPDFASADGYAALTAKAEQLIELGCSRFALLFDDITTTDTDGQVQVPEQLTRASVAMANQFQDFLQDRLGRPTGLWFCPTAYCARMSGQPEISPYLAYLGQQLGPQIEIFWTGPEIVSARIDLAHLREVAEVLHRAPLLWDNLHANDYDLRRLHLGPYSGRPPEIREGLRGIMVNPNCEFEANFVPLHTLGSFVHHRETWESRAAFLDAIQAWLPRWRLYSRQGELRSVGVEELTAFCDCFYLPFEHGPFARELLDEWTSLLASVSATWEARVDRYLVRAQAMSEFLERLGQLADRSLFQALCRHGWELKEELRLTIRYLEWRRAHPDSTDLFISGEHRWPLYRGGLVAELQRQLPMNPTGFPAPRGMA